MKNTSLILGMILFAALSRLIPHTPNVTAITAMALLGGAYLSNRSQAVFVPLAALFLTDLIFGFHVTLLFVYGAVALIAWLAPNGKPSWLKLGLSSLAASFLFFFITNFGFWWMGSLYEKSAAGLIQCYVMALPFLGTQVVGDLVYSIALFGAVQAVLTWNPSLARSRT
jgi:hypothetical protein